MRDKALSKAISMLGGNAAVARIFRISREAVGQWEKCPANRAVALAAATGNRVTPKQLRPDVFAGIEAVSEAKSA